jgi:hypothetical protein
MHTIKKPEEHAEEHFGHSEEQSRLTDKSQGAENKPGMNNKTRNKGKNNQKSFKSQPNNIFPGTEKIRTRVVTWQDQTKNIE